MRYLQLSVALIVLCGALASGLLVEPTHRTMTAGNEGEHAVFGFLWGE